MIVSLAIAAALGIFAILFEGFGDETGRIIGTALLVGGYSTVALLCAIVQQRNRLTALMWIGIGTGALALGIWLSLIWLDPWLLFDSYEAEKWIAMTGGTLTTLSIWAAHFGVLTLSRLDRPVHQVVRMLTQAVAAFLAVVIIAFIWAEFDIDEWAGKLMAILVILASCGTVVTPVLGLIEHLARRKAPETMDRKVEIDLVCPRCGAAQKMKAGAAKCDGCGLRIQIEVEEPRCACGYLLYKLQSDRCPECGREISDEQRWASPSL
jgi:hypothetical protein